MSVWIAKAAGAHGGPSGRAGRLVSTPQSDKSASCLQYKKAEYHVVTAEKNDPPP